MSGNKVGSNNAFLSMRSTILCKGNTCHSHGVRFVLTYVYMTRGYKYIQTVVYC